MTSSKCYYGLVINDIKNLESEDTEFGFGVSPRVCPPAVDDTKDLYSASLELQDRDTTQSTFGRMQATGRTDYYIVAVFSSLLSKYSDLPLDDYRAAFEVNSLDVPVTVPHGKTDSIAIYRFLRYVDAVYLSSGKRQQKSGALERPDDPDTTVLEELTGWVDQITDDIAYVRLHSKSGGDVLYGEYPADKLLAKGIGEGKRFRCRTLKKGNSVVVEIEPMQSRQVSDEEIRQLSQHVDSLFEDNDFDGNG